VKLKPTITHGNSKAGCWNHIGHLYSMSRKVAIEEMRYYCSPCVELEKKAGNNGHISKVASFAISTSTGTMALQSASQYEA